MRTHLSVPVRRKLEISFLIGPSLIFITLVIVFPLGYLVYASGMDWFFGKATGFTGLSNYWFVLTDSEFQQVLSNTLIISFGSTALGILMGLGFALLLNASSNVEKWLRVIVLIPYMVAWVAAGVTFKWILNTEFGIFNYVLMALGVDNPVNWLGQPHTALFSVIVVMAWTSVPFVTLILLAGLKAIPGELYEVSNLDGANSVQTFLHVTLPLIRPAVFTVLLIRTMFSLRNFDIPYSLTRGGPGISTKVLAILLREKLTTLQFGYNAALSIIMLVLTLIISLAYVRFLGKEEI